MNPLEYEQALLALTAWQVSATSSVDEMVAVACTIRNHVIVRGLGNVPTYRSYSEACEDFLANYPQRARPKLDDPAFVAPHGLLFQIAGIYDCTAEDVTATHDHPEGAKYFSNRPDDWFRAEIIDRPNVHPLIGSWGAMQFYV
jgi:hypothetical protein